ncbi:MAG: GTPase [Flavobacteriales bacterium]|jgi:hypothetical protein|nr:GTPase [Flavobacteriales bacterium]
MNSGAEKRLVFVYNAQSGWFYKASNFAHKIISPKTYNCELCALTHGSFRPKEEWLTFIQSLDYDIEFIYKDEVNIGKRRFTPPFVLKIIDGKEKVLIANDDWYKIKTTEEFIKYIKQRLA